MWLRFKNYDNGWKYPKMIGAAIFVSLVLRVIKNGGFVSGLEIGFMAAGLAAYFIGKRMNYNCELCAIVGVSSYSQVNSRMEEIRQEICNKLPNQEMRDKFSGIYVSMSKDKIEKAAYLTHVRLEIDKPQWMSQG